MIWVLGLFVVGLAAMGYGQRRMAIHRITPLEARHKLVTGQWRHS